MENENKPIETRVKELEPEKKSPKKKSSKKKLPGLKPKEGGEIREIKNSVCGLQLSNRTFK